MGQSKHSPRKVTSALRREDILARRADGLTYKALAAEFGLSQRRVREIIAEEFERLNGKRAEAAEGALKVSLDRLEKLLEAVWDEAMEGDLDSVSSAQGLVMNIARLHGLGLPPKDGRPNQVVVVGQGALEARAAALGLDLEQLRGPPPLLIESTAPSVPCAESS